MKHLFNHRVLQTLSGARVFALGALLLFAQQEAFTHQVGHILDATSLQSQQSKDEEVSELAGKPALQHASLCDFHATFASVLGAVGTAAKTPAFAQQAAEQRITYVAHVAPSDVVVPASRGPPVSLLS